MNAYDGPHRRGRDMVAFLKEGVAAVASGRQLEAYELETRRKDFLPTGRSRREVRNDPLSKLCRAPPLRAPAPPPPPDASSTTCR